MQEVCLLSVVEVGVQVTEDDVDVVFAAFPEFVLFEHVFAAAWQLVVCCYSYFDNRLQRRVLKSLLTKRVHSDDQFGMFQLIFTPTIRGVEVYFP